MTSNIFVINIVVLQYNIKYKGYIQQMKFITNNKLNPILFLEFKVNIGYGHYNIITINDYKDLKYNIYDKPLVINYKYNSEF